MQNDDPAIRLVALNALRSITGKDVGTDAAAWAKLLPPDPADSSSKTLMANGEAGTPPPLVFIPRPEPAYPPRPRSISDPRVDAEAQTVNNPATPGSSRGHRTPTGAPRFRLAPAAQDYPSHNPNLPMTTPTGPSPLPTGPPSGFVLGSFRDNATSGMVDATRTVR